MFWQKWQRIFVSSAGIARMALLVALLVGISWGCGRNASDENTQEKPDALAEAPSGKENEAERLFHAMEKKVRAAKSLKMICEFQGILNRAGEKFAVSAFQQFAGANQARFELTTTTEGQTKNSVFVSDGKQMVERTSDFVGEPTPADPNLNKALPAAIARGGFMLPRIVDRPNNTDFDADKMLHVGKFSLGAKERVGNVNGQAIEHDVTFGGLSNSLSDHMPVKVTVWIDLTTMLPLKRKVAAVDEKGFSFTEVYTVFVINPKLDAKVFELPK